MDDALRTALIDANTAIVAALRKMDSQQLVLPGNVCRHEGKVEAMGGYWFCPTCGANGREEQAHE